MTVDLKIRILASDMPKVRLRAERLGVSVAGLVRRSMGLSEPPPKGGAGRGQGRKPKDAK